MHFPKSGSFASLAKCHALSVTAPSHLPTKFVLESVRYCPIAITSWRPILPRTFSDLGKYMSRWESRICIGAHYFPTI